MNIASILLDKSYYHPGEGVHAQVTLDCQASAPTNVNVQLSVTYLANQIISQTQDVTVSGASQTITFTFTPPATTPAGYGLDILVSTSAGTLLATGSSSFDVLDN